jgi:hypothetical protein
MVVLQPPLSARTLSQPQARVMSVMSVWPSSRQLQTAWWAWQREAGAVQPGRGRTA